MDGKAAESPSVSQHLNTEIPWAAVLSHALFHVAEALKESDEVQTALKHRQLQMVGSGSKPSSSQHTNENATGFRPSALTSRFYLQDGLL
jgi:hypothetical protein